MNEEWEEANLARSLRRRRDKLFMGDEGNLV